MDSIIYDEKGNVLCQECKNRYFGQITASHLAKLHGMTVKDYYAKYPDSPITGKFKAERIAAGKKLSNQSKLEAAKIREVTGEPTSEVKIEELDSNEMENIIFDEPSTDQEIKEMVQNDKNFIDLKPNIELEQTTTEGEPIPEKKQQTKSRPGTAYKNKEAILKFLNTISPTEQNKMVQKRDPKNRLEFQVMTDICMPTKKVIFDFPRAFWHNPGCNLFYLKRLEDYGWKIITINDVYPTVDLIKRSLKNEDII